MKTKTAYRPKMPEPIIPQPDHPVIAENIAAQPTPEPKFDDTAPVETKEPESKKDEAAERIKEQLEADKRAQELHRQWQQQTQMAQRPRTRDELLDEWRQQGVSQANIEFLKSNPELIDGWQLTFHAAQEATQQGHEVDTDAHREATKRIFHERLAEAEKQMANNSAVPQPTPQFFQPPPAPRPKVPSRASIVSAPVSRRDGPSGEYDIPQDVRNVHLTAPEAEAARISGISPAEYAKQKLRMMRMKRDGEIV